MPIEVGVPFYQVNHFCPKDNDAQLRMNLDLLEEKGQNANLKVATFQQNLARFFNSKVKQRAFRIGELVLHRVMLNTKETNVGSLYPTW